MKIILNDSQEIEIPEHCTAKELADMLNLKAPDQALAANVNKKNVDLARLLKNGDTVNFLSFDSSDGKEIFWHTSAHVLAQAVLRIWPEAKPTIGPPIEQGFYHDFANLHISDNDFDRIEDEMKKIVSENYRSEKKVFKTKEEARKAFSHNKYKLELIDAVPEGEELSGYQQGEFFDLCRGPHLPNLGKIKAIKLLKTSGAYWRGDSKNEMLTRIYGITFPDRALLKEHLHILEEAKKRDHRVIGSKLNLFSVKEEGAGMPFIHPKGMIIWNNLLECLRERLRKGNYVEIKTPTMLSRELWEKSGHWQNYKENMFTSNVENHDYAIKPMNCPGCMLYFKGTTHSYRELPIRIAEIGNVHRFEPSGAISGLFRVRSFHQDDAHIFMKPEDIEKEVLSVLQFADEFYSLFGLRYHLELSTRPTENTIGTDKDWEVATQGLKGALDKWGITYKINEGDGAFYGPKIDFHIRDAIHRTWQCGTVQLDMALPERFELEYTAQDGSKRRPIMLHRAILGSIERFFGILIEHFSGKFPFWLSPRQVRILPVADRHLHYCNEIKESLQSHGLHVEIDDTNESISKKVRNAQLAQVNYMVTIGDKEIEHRTLNLRTRNNVVHGEMPLSTFTEAILEEKIKRKLHSPWEN